MAIYRLSSKSINRKSGRSAIAAAAYRAGVKLTDNKSGKTHDYTLKKGVDECIILLPDSASEKFKDREYLWNKVIEAEKRVDAEEAKELQLALPIELSYNQKVELAKEFAQKQFVEHGLACDIAFHKMYSHNPHCHIMFTTRTIEGEELNIKKARWIKPKNFLIDQRKEWEILVNKTFEKLGIDEVITADSYKTLGLNIKGVDARFNKYDREYVARIQDENTKEILNNIDYLATVLTSKKAVITDKDIERFINRNILPNDRENVSELLYKNANLVYLGKGKYTSISYLLAEQKLLSNINYLKSKINLNKPVDLEYAKQVAIHETLGEDQKAVFDYVLSNDSNIKSIIGFAGSGKSHAIGALVDVYKHSGYDVRGLALSGIVAENLANDCNIDSAMTIHRFLYRYDKKLVTLNQKSVVFVDEGSMVGTADYARLTTLIAQHGGKLININDSQQLQAISAGNANRMILENSSYLSLETIRRQKDEGDAEATKNLSINRHREALTNYKDKQAIIEHETKEKMYADVLATYVHQTQFNLYPDRRDTAIVMAFQRSVVEDVNLVIQSYLLKGDRLDVDKHMRVNGKDFYQGDRFIFLDNSPAIGVMNGTLGTIEKIQGKEVQVLIDTKPHEPPRRVNFNIKDYQNFDLAYAATIHKEQGSTLDNTQLIVDEQINSNLTLVGCSRHKYDFKLHYQKYSESNPDGIKNFDDLIEKVSRVSNKELVQDYDEKIIAHYKAKNPQLQQALADIAEQKKHTTDKSERKELKISEAEKKRLDKLMAQAYKLREKDNDLEVKEFVRNIDTNDRKISDEYKKIKDNEKALAKIIELDNRAKQAYKQSQDLNTKNSIQKELEAETLYSQRNDLLEKFDEHKEDFTDKVKESENYKKVAEINEQQIAHNMKYGSGMKI